MDGKVTDEVDEIVAAWQREREDLDSSPLEIFSRLLRLNRHLEKFRREAFAAHGLMLSAEISEFSEAGTWKKNNIHARYKK